MSGGPPKYSTSISDGLGQSLKQQTPKEYYQSHGGVSSHRQHYDDRNPYWDGNQWQYYNPSSEIYGSQYYQDSYYRRDFDGASSYAYGLSNPNSTRFYHPVEAMGRTPGLAVHSLSNPNSSSVSLRNQFETYSRSPKRRRIDIAGSDILDTSRYNPNSAAHQHPIGHHQGNFEDPIQYSKQNMSGATHFYDSALSEIEPAPLTSPNGTYGNVFSPYEQQQAEYIPPSSGSASSANRSSYGTYYPNTPYQQASTETKLSLSETGKSTSKVFVTPEHISSDKVSEINNQDVFSSTSSQSTADHTQTQTNHKSSLSGTKRAVTDRKQLQSKAWYERFEDLKKYKEKHGNCLVPQKYPPNPSLGIWVNKQRMEYKLLLDNEKSSMSPDRLESLQSIGFVWAKRKGQATWDAKYKQLLEYKAKNGDCLIPTKYAKNPALGRWVSTQREHYRMWKQGDPRSKMTVEKAKLLDEIGFVWRLQF